MADKNAEILAQAVARNLPAVLSLPSAGMLRNYKSRLVGDLEGGILVQAPENEASLIGELMRNQTPCGVSFRSGVMKVVFASPIRRVESGWRINEELSVDALLLEFPMRIKAAQKRSDYRAEIPKETDISLRIWRLGPYDLLKTEPLAATEVKAEIRDLSMGGAGVTLIGQDGQMPKICVEDRLRVELKYNGQAMILEGWMRAPNAAPQGDKIVTGIQFKKLQDDLEGRQKQAQLVRIVGELQRLDLRRARVGLTRAAC
jgi:c-di-GMP-binding flagellar brake protein YcgR